MSERLLESRISALRGQVRRLLVVHGLSWLVAGVLPLVILAGLLDWLFHLDVFVRLALLAIVAGLAGWLLFSRVLRPLVVRFADLDIAMRIEQRWPGLNDRLASTVQFLRLSPNDDRHGSVALREATIRQAIEETRSIDFREAIEYRPIIRSSALAILATAAALLLLAGAPASSRLALRRLFLPWAGDRWPQQTHLALDAAGTTLKIARGDPFALTVRVQPGDRVPETAYVTYQFADGEELVEPLRSSPGGEFRGRLETVNQPLRFSVAGGDDQASIRDVEVKVVHPPALNQLTIRLISPQYTGQPPQTLAAGLTSFRVLKGTVIEMEARANKALASARLMFGDQAAGEEVRFNAGRTEFRTSITASDNLAFRFALQDTEGFGNRDPVTHDVRVFKDEAPRVVITDPKTDRDVPQDATVPVGVELDDDYGLHSARLIYRTSTGESEPQPAVVIPLWTPPESKDPGQPVYVKHQEKGHTWELAPLRLQPGSIITFYADARDFDTISGPNIGKSREYRLRIVSREDASRQFDDARRELREEIARILGMQRQAITPVEEAERTLAKTERLPRSQRDDLNNAGLIQRQVGSRLSDRDEGLDQRLRRMLDDLRNFKIANPEAEQQMQDMRARLDRIRGRHQGPAEQGLTRASKGLEQIPDAPSDPANGKGSEGQKPQEADRQSEGQPKGAPSKGAAQPGASPDRPASPPKGQDQPSPRGQGEKAAKGQEGQQKGDTQDTSQAGRSPTPDAKDDDKTQANQPSATPADTARKALAEAKGNQKAIADELQKMLDGLSEFETYRGVVKDAQNLLKKQEDMIKQTAEASTRPDLMGRSSETLSPEQKAELGNLAGRQSEVAKGLEDLQERMQELARRLEETDPLAASGMREAASKSREQGTRGKMGEAADQLEKNQMGQARSRQEAARQELRELVDSVQNRRERELSRLVKELKKAESELRELRKRQAQNLKATREAKKNPNAQERKDQLKRLAKEQAQIQEELKRQLQKLAKLGADRAGRSAGEAQGKMSKAQEDLDQDQGDEADKQEEEALADLNDAQDELENARKEAEERLAMEQLARMGDQLKSLSERQAKMVTAAEGYEAIRRQTDGKLTIAQRAGVRGLGQIQAGLKDETTGLVDQLEGAPVFSLTLRRAAESMSGAAERLQALKTDEETLKATRCAHRLAQPHRLAPRTTMPSKAGRGAAAVEVGVAGGRAETASPRRPSSAPKTLQQEINERTESLDELRRRNQDLTPEQTREADQLGLDQGALADLVRDPTRPKRDDGEE
ncbi:MAG: DUF4175 family protein [Isosphaeraceae bacterium]